MVSCITILEVLKLIYFRLYSVLFVDTLADMLVTQTSYISVVVRQFTVNAHLIVA
jgi:hypothetical protein